MGKIRVVVLFGGQSSEHVVSCMSAANVIDRIDQEKYELLLIGITEEGRWIRTECVEDIRSGSWRDGTVSAVISPDATEKCVILMDGESAERVPVDVVFPVRGGRNRPGTAGAGEDPLCGLWCAGIRGFHG